MSSATFQWHMVVKWHPLLPAKVETGLVFKIICNIQPNWAHIKPAVSLNKIICTLIFYYSLDSILFYPFKDLKIRSLPWLTKAVTLGIALSHRFAQIDHQRQQVSLKSQKYMSGMLIVYCRQKKHEITDDQMLFSWSYINYLKIKSSALTISISEYIRWLVLLDFV